MLAIARTVAVPRLRRAQSHARCKLAQSHHVRARHNNTCDASISWAERPPPNEHASITTGDASPGDSSLALNSRHPPSQQQQQHLACLGGAPRRSGSLGANAPGRCGAVFASRTVSVCLVAVATRSLGSSLRTEQQQPRTLRSLRPLRELRSLRQTSSLRPSGCAADCSAVASPSDSAGSFLPRLRRGLPGSLRSHPCSLRFSGDGRSQ